MVIYRCTTADRHIDQVHHICLSHPYFGVQIMSAQKQNSARNKNDFDAYHDNLPKYFHVIADQANMKNIEIDARVGAWKKVAADRSDHSLLGQSRFL